MAKNSSHMHLFNAMGKRDSNEKIKVIINAKDTYITELERAQAVYTVIQLTQIVLWLLNSWTLTKGTQDMQEWIKNMEMEKATRVRLNNK